MPPPAKTLPHKSLETMPLRTAPVVVTTDDDTESCLLPAVLDDEQFDTLSLNAMLRLFQYGGEVAFVGEAGFSRQPVGATVHLARSLRPLRRRALSTARPPLVFMRARKPCRRFRRMTLG